MGIKNNELLLGKGKKPITAKFLGSGETKYPLDKYPMFEQYYQTNPPYQPGLITQGTPFTINPGDDIIALLKQDKFLDENFNLTDSSLEMVCGGTWIYNLYNTPLDPATENPQDDRDHFRRGWWANPKETGTLDSSRWGYDIDALRNWASGEIGQWSPWSIFGTSFYRLCSCTEKGIPGQPETWNWDKNVHLHRQDTTTTLPATESRYYALFNDVDYIKFDNGEGAEPRYSYCINSYQGTAHYLPLTGVVSDGPNNPLFCASRDPSWTAPTTLPEGAVALHGYRTEPNGGGERVILCNPIPRYGAKIAWDYIDLFYNCVVPDVEGYTTRCTSTATPSAYISDATWQVLGTWNYCKTPYVYLSSLSWAEYTEAPPNVTLYAEYTRAFRVFYLDFAKWQTHFLIDMHKLTGFHCYVYTSNNEGIADFSRTKFRPNSSNQMMSGTTSIDYPPFDEHNRDIGLSHYHVLYPNEVITFKFTIDAGSDAETYFQYAVFTFKDEDTGEILYQGKPYEEPNYTFQVTIPDYQSGGGDDGHSETPYGNISFDYELVGVPVRQVPILINSNGGSPSTISLTFTDDAVPSSIPLPSRGSMYILTGFYYTTTSGSQILLFNSSGKFTYQGGYFSSWINFLDTYWDGVSTITLVAQWTQRPAPPGPGGGGGGGG